MAVFHDPNTADPNAPVISTVKIKIDAIEARKLLAEVTKVLAGEARDLDGFLAAQILLSVDGGTMIILTEWSDHHTWAQSRYDQRVGKLMEHFLAKSPTLEFELFTRCGEIPRMPAN